MKTAKGTHRFWAGLLAVSLALVMGAGVPAISTFAAQLSAEAQTEAEGQTERKIAMKSSIETPATPAGLSDSVTESPTATNDTIKNAQGLSLSTAEEAEAQTEAAEVTGSSGMSVTGWIVALTVSFTVSGLILLGAAAALVYFFRRNWNRWGGRDDE